MRDVYFKFFSESKKFYRWQKKLDEIWSEVEIVSIPLNSLRYL